MLRLFLTGRRCTCILGPIFLMRFALVIVLHSCIHVWLLHMQVANFDGPLVDVSEETVERVVGQDKKHIQQHGAHNEKDIVRLVQATEAAAAAKAELKLPSRKPSRTMREEHKASDLGKCLLITGGALQIKGMRKALQHVLQVLPPALRAFVTERDERFFVSDAPAVPAKADHEVNVVCWCASDECVHVR